jgi:hypothetical protein
MLQDGLLGAADAPPLIGVVVLFGLAGDHYVTPCAHTLRGLNQRLISATVQRAVRTSNDFDHTLTEIYVLYPQIEQFAPPNAQIAKQRYD